MSPTVVPSPEEAVRSWPGDARVVALVSSREGGAIPFAALDLMEGLADRWRPALLASLQPGARLPDEGHAGPQTRGLAGVIRGEATLKEAARARPDRSFAFLPAGEDVGAEELLVSPALRRLAEGVRSAGGILVLHVPAAVSGRAPEWIDGRLRAGPEDGDGTAFGDELRDLGRLATGEDDVGETASGRWRRHRKGRDAPVARIVAAVVGVAVIVGGWWLLARESVDLPRTVTPPGDTAARVDTGAGAAGPEAAGDTGAAGPEAAPSIAAGRVDTTAARPPAGDTAAAGAGPEPDEEPAAESPELRYSVLVASYRRAADAARRVERLRESVTVPVFAAPTRVGDRMYHRVYAGAFEDTASAGELMRGLADRGLKRSVSAWDLRPVRWALLLGRFATEASARVARRELGSATVHGYLLSVVSGRDTAYFLYAGAFESSEAAVPLRDSLDAAGLGTSVMIRRGDPR